MLQSDSATAPTTETSPGQYCFHYLIAALFRLQYLTKRGAMCLSNFNIEIISEYIRLFQQAI